MNLMLQDKVGTKKQGTLLHSKNLTKHDGVFQVEVKQNDHLAVAWLEEGVLDVVVHDVDLVAPDAGVAEPVGVGLQHP